MISLLFRWGEGKGPLSFRTSRWKLWLLGTAAASLVVALTLAVLMFTPVAMVVPIPNPELEQKYGRKIKETQERLNSLAQNVLTLSDYNAQLRKALGEGGAKDSSTGKNSPRITSRFSEPPTDRDENRAMRTAARSAVVDPDFGGEAEMLPGGFSMVATEEELPRSNFPPAGADRRICDTVVRSGAESLRDGFRRAARDSGVRSH